MARNILAMERQLAKLKADIAKAKAARKRKVAKGTAARARRGGRGRIKLSPGVRDAYENFLEERLGPSPSWSDWVSLAADYAEDFQEHIDEAERQGIFEED